MTSIKVLRAFIVPFVLFFASIATAQSAPSAADFAQKTGTSFTISPNGQKLAFLTGEGKGAGLALLDLITSEKRFELIGDSTKPRSISWAGDNYILTNISFFFDAEKDATNSNYRYEMYRTLSYSVEEKKSTILMPNQSLQLNTSLGIEYVSQINPKDLIMSAISVRERTNAREEDRALLTLFKTDLATGKGFAVINGDDNTRDFILNPKGEVSLRVDVDNALRKVSLQKYNGRLWNKIIELDNSLSLPFSIEGFLDDETLLIIDEKFVVKKPQKLNINSGQITPIFETESRSISNVIMDPYKHEPIGLVYDNFIPKVKWLTPEMVRFQTLLESAFPGKYINIMDWDKTKTNLIVGVEAGDSHYTHFLFNTEKLSAEQISYAPEIFDNFKLAVKTIEKMTASDGLEISVLVTRPNNSANKKLPAIVLPHGGPQASDRPGFDYESQFLASRGYVVIQPQFRGSTGFGADFERMGYGEWAGKMQSDVNDTVKWAADKGWIDKDRVCIVGSSYGGYSALVGVAHTPDLYKCAASFGGVFDLAELQERAEERGGYRSTTLAYWKEHMGLSRFDRIKIRAISPLFQAQNVKVPVLLMHGVEDTVVPIKQSRDMANALRRAGKTVQLIEFEREDHWLSRQETRERFLVELEKFLGPILKPEQ